MAEVKVITVPEQKADKELDFKYEQILEDRNNAIAKRFGMEPLDVTLKFYLSRGALASTLDPNGDSMGVFSGYVDCSDEILITHPVSTTGLFDDVEKETQILLDRCLFRFYLCKKYYPEPNQFRMFHKYSSEVLSALFSGKFQAEIILFDIRHFSEEKKYKKDKELEMVLYIMNEKSGFSYIMEHLDKIMEDMDIRKTLFTIYKKTFNELVGTYQKEVQQQQREIERTKRRA
jgi:hypothetical protein